MRPCGIPAPLRQPDVLHLFFIQLNMWRPNGQVLSPPEHEYPVHMSNPFQTSATGGFVDSRRSLERSWGMSNCLHAWSQPF